MQVVKETKRYWLPLVIYALIMLAFGFCFDAATAWLARAGGTGGMSDYKQ